MRLCTIIPICTIDRTITTSVKNAFTAGPAQSVFDPKHGRIT